jgi:hypothetical protein
MSRHRKGKQAGRQRAVGHIRKLRGLLKGKPSPLKFLLTDRRRTTRVEEPTK